MDEQDREAIIWDDPREGPRGGWTVLRRQCHPLPVEPFANILVDCGEILKPDATKICRQSGGILLDNVQEDQARRVAEGLSRNGEECLLVPAARIVDAPRALPIHSVHLTATDMGPTDAMGKRRSAPWDRCLAMAMANVEAPEKSSGPGGARGRGLRKGLAGPTTGEVLSAVLGDGPRSPWTGGDAVVRTTVDIVFDEPMTRYRIDARGFDYGVLADRRQHYSKQNIQILARWLLHAAPHIQTSFSSEALMQMGEVEVPAMARRMFDEVVKWLVNVARLGL